MAGHPAAVAVVGETPLAQTNAFFTALATNALNALLGSIEQPGGINFTPQAVHSRLWVEIQYGNLPVIDSFAYRLLEGDLDSAKVLLLYEADPVFALPPTFRVREA